MLVFIKFGKDILINTTYRGGHYHAVNWFERQFPEYRWHKVYIGEDHLDGEFVIIKPGLILYNPSRNKFKLWSIS